MITHFRKAALVLAGAAALAACRKDSGITSIEGAVPTPGFTFTVDASQYPVTVTFKNTTTDAFLYQWDFGDGSALSSGQNVTHVYKDAGSYRVQLTAAGRGGSSVTPQVAVTIPSICVNQGFAVLTACDNIGSATWTLSDQPGAVIKLSASGAVVSTSATLNACQLDDAFSFAKNFTYSYDAGAQTFQAGACGTALTNKSDFVYKPNGSLGQIVLQTKKTFIGLADSSVNKTYDIIEATTTPTRRLRLQATNPDGTKTITTYIPQQSVLEKTKAALTGGSSRTWTLDNTVAGAISVGTESNPTRDYVSGAAGSIPSCQADDEYTFTVGNDFLYEANGQTFVAGPYSCMAARTDNSTTYTYGPVASGAGIGQFVLNKAGSFIGVTDAPTSRVYRILSISNTHMQLRAGAASDPGVFTFEMKVK